MQIHNKQQGFSLVEGMLVLLVVGLIGAMSISIVARRNEASVSDSSHVPSKPIQTQADLQSAIQELDAIDIEALDTSELDAIEDELL